VPRTGRANRRDAAPGRLCQQGADVLVAGLVGRVVVDTYGAVAVAGSDRGKSGHGDIVASMRARRPFRRFTA